MHGTCYSCRYCLTVEIKPGGARTVFVQSCSMSVIRALVGTHGFPSHRRRRKPEKSSTDSGSRYRNLLQAPNFAHLGSTLNHPFRFLGFLLWFVVGSGRLQGGPGGPRKAHGGRQGASGGPRARAKQPNNPYLLQGPCKRRRCQENLRYELQVELSRLGPLDAKAWRRKNDPNPYPGPCGWQTLGRMSR
jgi:hypothetical protein